NIYNNSWAERYHGLKEVPIGKETIAKATTPKKKFGKPADDDDDMDTTKKDDAKKDDAGKNKEESKQGQDAKDAKDKDAKAKSDPEMRFEIKVPTNAELAVNLKGRLLLVHGDMDNNVHPANTIRLVDALIKANKRFDMLILPGKAHAFANYQPYFNQRMWEYFAEYLLGDRAVGVDLFEKRDP